MNVVNHFLSKAGMQVVLTAQSMRNGGLDKESADKLAKLMEMDHKLDVPLQMALVEAFYRHRRVGKPSKYPIVDKLTSINLKYYLSSIHSDLCRWVEINEAINAAHTAAELTVSESYTVLYVVYIEVPHFTLFPTSPISLSGSAPIIISDMFDEDKVANASTGTDKGKSKSVTYPDVLLKTTEPCTILEEAAKLFDPANIKQLAKESPDIIISDTSELNEIVNSQLTELGFIDYRTILLQLLRTELKLTAEME